MTYLVDQDQEETNRRSVHLCRLMEAAGDAEAQAEALSQAYGELDRFAARMEAFEVRDPANVSPAARTARAYATTVKALLDEAALNAVRTRALYDLDYDDVGRIVTG